MPHTTKYRAYLCFGPNCGPKDSRSLLTYLTDEVARLGLADEVTVLATGCQAHCLSGPTMVVYPGPIYYQEVTTARLDRIISEHLVGNSPVSEFFWSGKRIRVLPKPVLREANQVVTAPREPQAPAKLTPTRKAPDVDDFKW